MSISCAVSFKPSHALPTYVSRFESAYLLRYFRCALSDALLEEKGVREGGGSGKQVERDVGGLDGGGGK